MQTKRLVTVRLKGVSAAALMSLALVLLIRPAMSATKQAKKQPFNAAGTYVEICSCSPPCPCSQVGINMGCEGMGAITLTSGRYQGVNLAGARFAAALGLGKWVRLYVDARNARQRQAVTAFARAYFKDFGNLESVQYVPVSITGGGGWYKVSVAGGKIMQYSTKPILGADKKTPVSHGNVADPLSHTYLQGKSVAGHYKDGTHEISLKDTNSYFYHFNRRSQI